MTKLYLTGTQAAVLECTNRVCFAWNGFDLTVCFWKGKYHAQGSNQDGQRIEAECADMVELKEQVGNQFDSLQAA